MGRLLYLSSCFLHVSVSPFESRKMGLNILDHLSSSESSLSHPPVTLTPPTHPNSCLASNPQGKWKWVFIVRRRRKSVECDAPCEEMLPDASSWAQAFTLVDDSLTLPEGHVMREGEVVSGHTCGVRYLGERHLQTRQPWELPVSEFTLACIHCPYMD